jgi:hypothetical protein
VLYSIVAKWSNDDSVIRALTYGWRHLNAIACKEYDLGRSVGPGYLCRWNGEREREKEREFEREFELERARERREQNMTSDFKRGCRTKGSEGKRGQRWQRWRAKTMISGPCGVISHGPVRTPSSGTKHPPPSLSSSTALVDRIALSAHG